MKLTLITAAMMMVSAPALANQWVKGTVDIVEDYTAFSSSQGLLVTLLNQQWGNGTQSNGATVCTGRFSVVIGQQSVTADLYTRMYAMLLTGKAQGATMAMWVDTSTAPECRVQIVSFGRLVI